MDNLRSTIAAKILSKIPPQVKPIDYLMRSLDISRESVYRRIRGDISFTLEEMVILSIDLGFSIDELTLKDMHSRMFFDVHVSHDQNPSDIYVSMIEQYFQSIFDAPHEKEIETIMITNHVPCRFIVFFNHLLKFTYYRWMHQHLESSLKYCYSDVVMPEKLIYLQQKIIHNFKKFRNNTLILDSNFFQNLILEIQYYYKRKLINDNELALIKEDLLRLINMIESIAQNGYFDYESKYDFYLSSLHVESTSQIIRYDNQMKLRFHINSTEPITITNVNLCIMHKKWLDSMRKYSTLISQSNEILQAKYFFKQRSLIEKISEI